jgi:hypothetical protein
MGSGISSFVVPGIESKSEQSPSDSTSPRSDCAELDCGIVKPVYDCDTVECKLTEIYTLSTVLAHASQSSDPLLDTHRNDRIIGQADF